MAKFPVYKQFDAMDCGPSCLRMIAKYYGKTYSIQTLRDKCFITREGVSLLGISDAAESIGLRSKGIRITFEQLKADVPKPCIIHWNQKHFIIVYRITNKKVYVADPAHGLLKYTHDEFIKSWIQDGGDKGLCLLLEKAPDFHLVDDELVDKSGFKFLFSFINPYKKYIFQLVIGLLLGSLVLLLFPFLTQQIVDYGINNQNIGFIYLVLIAQLILFLGRASVDFIRGWILLHISTRVNISLISDFLIKLMKLPIGFFDTKKIGDLLQRISDHTRIESFLTTSTLSILFSFVNLIVFGIVLGFYSLKILAVFLIGSLFYFIWVYLFMKKRRDLDYKRFSQLADNQGTLIQLISGMQEIKLNNCEKQKRWDWENIQAKLFRVNVKGLSLNQNQRAGATILNESKNIFITFIAASAVISGSMSLGMMLAVIFMIGQLNSPLEQLIVFLNKSQDAKISLERLAEIHKKEDEDSKAIEKISFIPEDKSIYIDRLSFQYEGPHSETVLNDINLSIPAKKVTAIVGTSGSGKTTLLKLILGFYPPIRGEIKVGDINLQSLNEKVWRNKCGTVMQDGFIFSDSIAQNVAISDERIDQKRFYNAIKLANIQQFVQNLPLGYNTKIGADGHGLSQGQKQRILIARAVYKNPDFLFFDEATNALDANNEKIIMNNLEEFMKGKTVMIIAHRLSTVKNADQIIVLEKGKIIEIGNHAELAERRSTYYDLVKNQLELGV